MAETPWSEGLTLPLNYMLEEEADVVKFQKGLE
jgi:hypothetical protein